MANDPNKTVFISYRRSVSRDRAILIFNHLREHGYDVFLDVKTIDSGAFDSVILNQIGARTHFVVLIADGALQRCQNEGDWLRCEIEEALKLGRNIVPIIDEGVNFDQEMGYLPSEWRDQFKRINSLPWAHYYFDSALRDLVERFLKPPEFPVKINVISNGEQHEVQQRLAELMKTSQKPSSLDIMPQPFAWITIPAGKVMIKKGGYLNNDTPFNIQAFQIAKYPITNAQFDIFIKHPEGYSNPKWWDFSDDARRWRTKNIKPADKRFIYDLNPRVNITWYEAVAFCRWIYNITGEEISLPSEQQWQRAAQGDDNRNYSWGNKWQNNYCRNRVGASLFFVWSTTPVIKYETKGDSPFGVVDMTGNIWEWSSTGYQTGHNELNSYEPRILKGGSWSGYSLIWFSTYYRDWGYQENQGGGWGFRLIKNIK